jgi:raffinose/stachyose/melibiose transport system permease protein
MTSRNRKAVAEYGLSMLFILPSLALFVPFVLFPIVNTLQISFYRWNGIEAVRRFAGFTNYLEAFREPRFLRSLSNTGIWVLLHIVLACGTALFLAFQIARIRRGQVIFRTVLFLPNVIALPISAVIWGMMYNPNWGIIKRTLVVMGLGGYAPNWLGNPNLALYSIGFASAWQAYGYYLVLYLAGLQNIDEALYEAAELDGARTRHVFFSITIPSLRNVMTFVLSMAIINGLSGFATVWTMTQGGPAYATYLLTLYVYTAAFGEYNYGLAMVGGVVLGILIVTITVCFNALRARLNA